MMHERLESQTFNGHRLATVFHDTGATDVVVFCHGFRGVKTGPSRFFVRAARRLAQSRISSLRFDQYGSGDSEGEFEDAGFDDWIATTKAIVMHYTASGYRVALWGQSMGGAAAIGVAAEVPGIVAVVAWVPDANVEPFAPSPTGFIEEGGQIVREGYWREAHDARIADRLGNLDMPVYLVFGTADEFVDERNRRALIERARPQHRIDVFEGMVHSAWDAAQADEIIGRSVDFVADSLRLS